MIGSLVGNNKKNLPWLMICWEKTIYRCVSGPVS